MVLSDCVCGPAAPRPATCRSSPDPRLWEYWFRLSHCFCVLVPLRLRQEKTDTVRCIKSCRPNDVTCATDPMNTISHTFVSLPTFREFTRPEGEW